MSSINVAESFRDDVFTTLGAVTDPIAKGAREPVILPEDATKHYVWLAAGAYFQNAKADHWWVVGRLHFYWRGTRVGQFQFTDASSEITGAERLAAPRPLLRIRPDAQGSIQPAFRYQSNQDITYSRDNLDLPAFLFERPIDRLIYELEASYYTLGAAFIGFLTGVRVLSY